MEKKITSVLVSELFLASTSDEQRTTIRVLLENIEIDRKIKRQATASAHREKIKKALALYNETTAEYDRLAKTIK